MNNFNRRFAFLFLAICSSILINSSSCMAQAATVTDVDGNVYHTVKIGTQIWMVENLRTTRLRDGSPIATSLGNDAWKNTQSAAYAEHPGADGLLYNWFAVNTRQLAPKGWHIATRNEWDLLVGYLGGSSNAGGKMKATTGWDAPNAGASNSAGFAGLPGGYRGTTGSFGTKGKTGYWWASSERNSTQGDYINLDRNSGRAMNQGATKQFGYSVRCVKDSPSQK